jgi:hypothetical protein
MKLLPVDLACLEEIAHLLTGVVKPRLEAVQRRRYSEIEQDGRVPVLAGRSLQGRYLLQVPLGHDPGQELIGLADPGLPRLDAGFGAIGLGADGGDTGMLAQLGRPDAFEAKQVEPDIRPSEFPVERLDNLQDTLWYADAAGSWIRPPRSGIQRGLACDPGSGHSPREPSPAGQASSG